MWFIDVLLHTPIDQKTSQDRLQILSVHLRALKHSLSEADVQHLALKCHGYVGADLKRLLHTAALRALEGHEALKLSTCLECLKQVVPSALKELFVEVPQVFWSDIGGYEATKEALKEAVEWPIYYKWAFEAMQMEPPRGVLLYGPPGCSKTMMAKAVATESEMNFISVKGAAAFVKGVFMVFSIVFRGFSTVFHGFFPCFSMIFDGFPLFLGGF